MQELVLIQPGRTLESELARKAAEASLRLEFEERLADAARWLSASRVASCATPPTPKT
jgi:hypothetical protein